MKVLFFLLPLTLFADPWGKDAELAHWKPPSEQVSPTESLVVTFAEKMIRFHQNNTSIAAGPQSHYYPSSSQYTLDAMKKYGFLSGFYIGCERLLRENDDLWYYKTVDGVQGPRKWDPVR